jgi:hypothetical protein
MDNHSFRFKFYDNLSVYLLTICSISLLKQISILAKNIIKSMIQPLHSEIDNLKNFLTLCEQKLTNSNLHRIFKFIRSQ